MLKKPNDKDNDSLSPEELAFAAKYDNKHSNTNDYLDDAQAWAKKLLGDSNSINTNNHTDKA